jgi:hypothetical protein
MAHAEMDVCQIARGRHSEKNWRNGRKITLRFRFLAATAQKKRRQVMESLEIVRREIWVAKPEENNHRTSLLAKETHCPRRMAQISSDPARYWSNESRG